MILFKFLRGSLGLSRAISGLGKAWYVQSMSVPRRCQKAEEIVALGVVPARLTLMNPGPIWSTGSPGWGPFLKGPKKGFFYNVLQFFCNFLEFLDFLKNRFFSLFNRSRGPGAFKIVFNIMKYTGGLIYSFKKCFFEIFDVGPLFRYKRYFNTIIRCRDLSRSIDLD